MMTPQLILDLNQEIIVDNFAGGGGASSGIEEALGRPVDHAINHDEWALGMHRINHTQTVHHGECVFDVDPAKIAGRRRVGFGWFSPDCKHFSKAKGGKPLDKKIRGLVLVILRWAAIRTRVITMENVEEIKTWGPLLKNGKPDKNHKGRTWLAFLAALGPGLDPDHPDIPEMLELLRGTITKEQLVKGFGYDIETREIRACDHGAPTIRKRLFMIARCDGRPIVWPAITHVPPDEARSKRLQPHRMIAECIDWDIPCPSIFLTPTQALRLNRQHKIKCNRPLKKATLRRIAAGVDRYVLKAAEPFIICLTHQGGDRVESVSEPAKTITGANRGEKALVDARLAPIISDANRPREERGAPANEPMRTLCAGVKGGHFQLVAGSMIEYHAPKRPNDQRAKPVDKPLPVQTTEPRFGLVATHLMKFQAESDGAPMDKPGPTITANSYVKKPGGAAPVGLCAASMVKFRGDPKTHAPGHPAEQPGHTQSAGGLHHALSACYMAQHNGGYNTNPGHPATDPSSTISAKGSQQQIVSAALSGYYGSEADGQAVTEPARTVTTKARYGLTQTEASNMMTDWQIAGARRVAKFLRSFGVKFEGEFAMVAGCVIWDIGMRMLKPRELFRAQGFREAYVIDRAWLVNPKTGEIREEKLTTADQIRMCGNSVSPPVARAITAANVPELAVWKIRDKQRFFSTRDRKPVFA